MLVDSMMVLYRKTYFGIVKAMFRTRNLLIVNVSSFRETAKKFGVTEFVNPKDHNKPIQQVRLSSSMFRSLMLQLLYFDRNGTLTI